MNEFVEVEHKSDEFKSKALDANVDKLVEEVVKAVLLTNGLNSSDTKPVKPKLL